MKNLNFDGGARCPVFLLMFLRICFLLSGDVTRNMARLGLSLDISRNRARGIRRYPFSSSPPRAWETCNPAEARSVVPFRRWRLKETASWGLPPLSSVYRHMAVMGPTMLYRNQPCNTGSDNAIPQATMPYRNHPCNIKNSHTISELTMPYRNQPCAKSEPCNFGTDTNHAKHIGTNQATS